MGKIRFLLSYLTLLLQVGIIFILSYIWVCEVYNIISLVLWVSKYLDLALIDSSCLSTVTQNLPLCLPLQSRLPCVSYLSGD